MLAVCLVTATALIPAHQEKRFVAFMRDNGYSFTGSEYHFRFGLYLSHARHVQEHNAAGLGFTLSLNKFAVYTPAEYKFLLGARPSSHDPSLSTPFAASDRDPPDSWDWRTEGAVLPVKDQGQCGSCWAFSAISAQESQNYIVNKVLTSLSEQNLIDCVVYCTGCDGGSVSSAYNYVIQRQSGKFNTEAGYPYTAREDPCRFSEADATSLLVATGTVVPESESALLNVVYLYGPVTVLIDASHVSFQLYKSGVYDEPACSTSNLDHALVVVGYGAFGTVEYWIARNSWGTSWGEDGYILMSRNKGNQCGIATLGIIPKDE
jgi:cathepsin L